MFCRYRRVVKGFGVVSSTAQVMLKEGKNMNLDGTQGIQPLQPMSGVDRVQKINTNVYNPAENSIKTNVSRDQEHLNGYETSNRKQQAQNVQADSSDDMDLDEDDMVRFLMGNTASCPYYQSNDEYLIVRHQM